MQNTPVNFICQIDATLAPKVPQGFGYVLLLAPLYDPSQVIYVTNAHPDEAVSIGRSWLVNCGVFGDKIQKPISSETSRAR